MTLDEYLINAGVTEAAFAETVGCSQPAINRYRRGHRIPLEDEMRRIIAATEGRVTPNDFYGVANATSDNSNTVLTQAPGSSQTGGRAA